MWSWLANLAFKFFVGHAPLDTITKGFSKVEDQLSKLVDVKTTKIDNNLNAITKLTEQNDNHQSEVEQAKVIISNLQNLLGKNSP